MSLLPRRRSFLLKFLLLIPAVWFCAVLLFAYGGNNNSGPVPQQSDSGSEKRERRSENEIDNGNKDNYRTSKVIQGFGPPMAVVPDKEKDTEKIDDEVPNLKKPKFVIDQNSPIYKHEKDQAGEMGKPVNVNKTGLSTAEKKKYDEGWTNNAFNQYASDMISLHRALPAAVDKECLETKYQADLPDTSVVICFHNEAWSVLLRTVHSVIERTPDKYLKEVILVDDFSDKDHLKEPLQEYMSQFSKVKILRLDKREGLIRARLKGFDIATGQVLTYLDSHCECTEGWLEPLLARIKADPKTVVCPVIDVIDDTTFEYHYSRASFTNVGGFDWSLQFNWHPIPERDRKNRKQAIDPVPSPTMAGGLFAIDKEYFRHLGTYDPGFDIWGGENLELSFKIWMCGGRLEIIPCSHVGHIFRKRSPYKWRTGVNVLKRNTIRLAEVWLDEYKKYYYERINWQLGDYGDISDRVALRKGLNCTTFKSYLDNIYPELFVPGDAVASGEYWMLSKDGEIRRDESCVDFAGQDVMIFPCHGMKGNQEWRYDPKKNSLLHSVTNKCLEMTQDGARLAMKPCDPTNLYQQWVFKNYDPEKAKLYGMASR